MWLFKHAAQRCRETAWNSNEALPFTSAASPRWGRARERESTHSPLYSMEEQKQPEPGREDRSSQRPRRNKARSRSATERGRGGGRGGGTHPGCAGRAGVAPPPLLLLLLFGYRPQRPSAAGGRRRPAPGLRPRPRRRLRQGRQQLQAAPRRSPPATSRPSRRAAHPAAPSRAVLA